MEVQWGNCYTPAIAPYYPAIYTVLHSLFCECASVGTSVHFTSVLVEDAFVKSNIVKQFREFSANNQCSHVRLVLERKHELKREKKREKEMIGFILG